MAAEFLDSSAIIDGVRIAYRDRGNGPAVVLVHGTPSYSYEWREVAPAIESHGYRVVTYDLLGYGSSERPLHRDTSVDAQVELLKELSTHLGLERPAVIGHDLGGAIAQILAAEGPEWVSAVALLDTVSYDSWPSRTWQQIVADHLDSHVSMTQDEFDTVLRRQLQMTVASPERMQGPTLAAFLEPHNGRLGRTSFFEHQVRTYDSSCTRRVAERLGDISVPVLVLWGEDDQWQPVHYAYRLASDISHAKLVTLPDAGHFLTEDAPARVADELLTFLAEHGSPVRA